MEYHAEAPAVDFWVVVLLIDYFGRDSGQGAAPAVWRIRGIVGASYAEICQFQFSFSFSVFLIYQEVLKLDVTMYDIVLMAKCYRFNHLVKNLAYVILI